MKKELVFLLFAVVLLSVISIAGRGDMGDIASIIGSIGGGDGKGPTINVLCNYSNGTSSAVFNLTGKNPHDYNTLYPALAALLRWGSALSTGTATANNEDDCNAARDAGCAVTDHNAQVFQSCDCSACGCTSNDESTCTTYEMAYGCDANMVYTEEFDYCDISCALTDSACPFYLTSYALGANKAVIPASNFKQWGPFAGSGGSSLDFEGYMDLDDIWNIFGVSSETASTVPYIRFVADPFVTLNISGDIKEPFFKVHNTGEKTTSVNCKADDSKGGISSATECVDYTISKKLADCNAEASLQNPCCGDDDLVNPGFEADPQQEQYISDVWSVTGTDKCTEKETGYCRTTGQMAHTGNRSYTMETQGGEGAVDSQITQEADLANIGGPHAMSIYAKTTNNGGAYASSSSSQSNILSGTNGWRHYWIPFAPGGLDTFGFYTGSNQPADYQLWIDDFHLLGPGMDLGDIQKKVIAPETGEAVYYLCNFNGNEWNWLKSTDDSNLFRVFTIAGFDILSNYYRWQACNVRNMAALVYSSQPDVDLIGEYNSPTYNVPATSPTVVTPGQITTTGYGFGDTSIAMIIPENDFLSGLEVSGIQPPGAPAHCFNNETDEDETDVDCGGPYCARCYDGKNCTIDDDCFSANCVDGKCTPVVPEDLTSMRQYLAKRFICSKQDEFDAFTECCGSSLGNCVNSDQLSKVRRASNPLSTIYEFPALDDVNYVLMFGLLSENLIDYQLPMYIESSQSKKGADTRMTDWTGYDYLEFYISYATMPVNFQTNRHYLRLLVLNQISADYTARQYIQGNPSTIESSVLFRGYVDDFIVNQEEEGKWLHVKIPISSSSNKLSSIRKDSNVKALVLYADIRDVPVDRKVRHRLFPNDKTYSNIIAVDRIFLTNAFSRYNYYCSKYPATLNNFGIYWINDMDTQILDITRKAPMGKAVCDETMGYGWTGNICCGDDTTSESKFLSNINRYSVAESFSDNSGEAGCVKGNAVKNNSAVVVKYNNSVSAGEASLLFFNGSFYSCNNAGAFAGIVRELNYSADTTGRSRKVNESLFDINTTPVAKACYNAGSWYCDFDSYWKNATRIPGEVINASRALPPNLSGKGCCPSSYCFAGQTYIPGKKSNETGALMWNASCVQSQANYLSGTETLGKPYFFNSSKFYTLTVRGNNNFFRCVNGSWQLAVLKWNPDHTERGYCNMPSQCYLNTSTCLDTGDFFKDSICYNGNWTSRTRYLASQLLSLTHAVNYTLYCDSYDKVLAQYNYIEGALSRLPVIQILLGEESGAGVTIGGETVRNYTCPNMKGSGVPCTNNFCAIKYQELGEGEKIAIGTTLNLPADTEQYSDYSILNVFKEAVKTEDSRHNDFCDAAIILSANGTFYGCKGFNRALSPSSAEKANIWINNKTQALIYIKQGDNFQADTLGDVFTEFFKNPIQTAYYVIWNYMIYKNNINQTSDFLNTLADFKKLYISALNSKEIRGLVEQAGTAKKMVISYRNINKNLCYGNTTKSQLRLGSGLWGAQCTVIIDENSFTQDYFAESDFYWKDLTSNTRISGTESPGDMGISISIEPDKDYIELGDAINFTYSIPSRDDIIAYSYDFNDSLVFSTDYPIYFYTYVYNRTGNYTPSFGILSENFTIAYASMEGCPVRVVPPFQIMAPSFEEDTSLVMDLSEYADGISIYVPPEYEWLGCSAESSERIVTCTPYHNMNGMGIITIALEYCGKSLAKNITLNVIPVNDYPYFTAELPAVNFTEDYDFSLGPPFQLNLLDYVGDNETNLNNLRFELSYPMQDDLEGKESFGCYVNYTEDGRNLICMGPGELNFNGIINMTVTVRDGEEGGVPYQLTNSTQFIINVTPVNDIPQIFFPNIYVEMMGTGNYSKVQDVSIGGHVLDVEDTVDGGGLSLTCNGTETFCRVLDAKTRYNYTPAQGPVKYFNVTQNITVTIDNENHTLKINISTTNATKEFSGNISLTVTDSEGGNASQNVTIFVSATNVPPSVSAVLVSPANTNITQPSNITYKVTATDSNSGQTLKMNYTILNKDKNPVTSPPGIINFTQFSNSSDLSEANFSWSIGPVTSGSENVYYIRFNATDSGTPKQTIFRDEKVVLDDLPKGDISHIIDWVNGQYMYVFTAQAWDFKGGNNEALYSCYLDFGDGERLSGPCNNIENISTVCEGGACQFGHVYETPPPPGEVYQPAILLRDQMGGYTVINDSPIGDPIPPVVTLISPTMDSIWTTPSVNVSITASDTSGISKIWFVNCTGGNVTYPTTGSPMVSTRCDPGLNLLRQYSITAYAKDTKGNVGQAGSTFYVNLTQIA